VHDHNQREGNLCRSHSCTSEFFFFLLIFRHIRIHCAKRKEPAKKSNGGVATYFASSIFFTFQSIKLPHKHKLSAALSLTRHPSPEQETPLQTILPKSPHFCLLWQESTPSTIDKTKSLLKTSRTIPTSTTRSRMNHGPELFR
jgi:hypothetical protein